MKYQVAKACKADLNEAIAELAGKVNALLTEGWEPVGGISVAFDSGGAGLAILCQALIKP